jgi:hypothetical protein
LHRFEFTRGFKTSLSIINNIHRTSITLGEVAWNFIWNFWNIFENIWTKEELEIFRVSTSIQIAKNSEWVLDDAYDANALNYKHGMLQQWWHHIWPNELRGLQNQRDKIN